VPCGQSDRVQERYQRSKAFDSQESDTKLMNLWLFRRSAHIITGDYQLRREASANRAEKIPLTQLWSGSFFLSIAGSLPSFSDVLGRRQLGMV
jgi:hypothetical protein